LSPYFKSTQLFKISAATKFGAKEDFFMKTDLDIQNTSNTAADQLKHALAVRKALFGNRLLVPTEVAAEALGRSPKTLRKWSMLGRGPLHPVRVDGGLLWRVDDLMRLAGEIK
jgi:hypothetical protein